jgi:hypothetical protein
LASHRTPIFVHRQNPKPCEANQPSYLRFYPERLGQCDVSLACDEYTIKKLSSGQDTLVKNLHLYFLFFGLQVLTEGRVKCGITPGASLINRVAIGQGSFGKVYSAEHLDWGPVALKRLSENEFIDQR